ncbi:hypothetical protein P8605_02370 [Streptomyces sp. T-3]|nr:hypothetical protein [Streptomyces sp. T-3]
MDNPLDDYRALVTLDLAELRQALRNSSPKAKGQWIFALLDIARTDYHPVNQETGINLEMRLLFASRLLDFVDQELSTPDRSTTITLEYMKVARKAIDGGAREVPPSLHADAVVRRALTSFRLNRMQALEMATAQRNRYLDALTSGLGDEELNHAVSMERGSELQAIIVLLSECRWFQEEITDRGIAGELNAWLDICPDLSLGDTVAELLNRRQRNHQKDV